MGILIYFSWVLNTFLKIFEDWVLYQFQMEWQMCGETFIIGKKIMANDPDMESIKLW